MTDHEKQKKYLRGLAHGRDPVVLIGQSGLSPAITGELDTALGAHELVKVRARVGDRDQRDSDLRQSSRSRRTAPWSSASATSVCSIAARKDKPRIILPAD